MVTIIKTNDNVESTKNLLVQTEGIVLFPSSNLSLTSLTQKSWIFVFLEIDHVEVMDEVEGQGRSL